HVLAQRVHVVPRHGDLVFRAEVEQRRRTYGSVEVTVQLRLRQAPKELRVDERHEGQLSTSDDAARSRLAMRRRIEPALMGVDVSIGSPRLSVMRRRPSTTSSAAAPSNARTASKALASRGTSTPEAFTNTRMVSGMCENHH